MEDVRHQGRPATELYRVCRACPNARRWKSSSCVRQVGLAV